MADLPDMSHLLDVPLEVEAVVEGPPLRISHLLGLEVGSVVTTRRASGENVDIFVGSAYLGAGELARASGRRVVRMVKFKGKS